MRGQTKGYGFFVIILIVLLGAVYFSGILENNNRVVYNMNMLLNDIEKDSVGEVQIYQEKEVRGNIKVRKKAAHLQARNRHIYTHVVSHHCLPVLQ